MTQPDDARTLTVYGQHGRDAGKQYTILEIDPLTAAGYALRLNSAMRIESYETLIAEWKAASEEGGSPIDLILGALRGADAKAVHTLIEELLDYVRVSPDPRHPGVNRALLADRTDIRELKTLGEVLAGVLKLNFAGVT